MQSNWLDIYVRCTLCMCVYVCVSSIYFLARKVNFLKLTMKIRNFYWVNHFECELPITHTLSSQFIFRCCCCCFHFSRRSPRARLFAIFTVFSSSFENLFRFFVCSYFFPIIHSAYNKYNNIHVSLSFFNRVCSPSFEIVLFFPRCFCL